MEQIEQKLKKQIKDLNTALDRLDESLMEEKTEFIRDAVIQRFEFCFEIAWKTMKTANYILGFQSQSPRDTIRSAAQTGLIDNPKKWLNYLTARNLSTHTYNEEQSEQIYKKAKEFAPNARELVKSTTAKLKA